MVALYGGRRRRRKAAIVVDVTTAKALGIEVPSKLLYTAGDVVE